MATIVNSVPGCENINEVAIEEWYEFIDSDKMSLSLTMTSSLTT